METKEKTSQVGDSVTSTNGKGHPTEEDKDRTGVFTLSDTPPSHHT